MNDESGAEAEAHGTDGRPPRHEYAAENCPDDEPSDTGGDPTDWPRRNRGVSSGHSDGCERDRPSE
jgi:hypothetical protein